MADRQHHLAFRHQPTPRTCSTCIAAAAAKAAFAALISGEFPDPVTVKLPPAPADSQTTQRVTGSFELTHSGVFALSLIARDGTPSDTTPGGPLIALPDEAPRIQMLEPDLRVMVPPSGEVTLVVHVP